MELLACLRENFLIKLPTYHSLFVVADFFLFLFFIIIIYLFLCFVPNFVCHLKISFWAVISHRLTNKDNLLKAFWKMLVQYL